MINDNQMTSEQARAFALSKLNSTYANGTSWSGSRLGVHVAQGPEGECCEEYCYPSFA